MFDRVNKRTVLVVFAALMPGLLLSGCATTSTAQAMLDGPTVPAPAGWVEYCHRNGADTSCRDQATTVALRSTSGF